MLQLGAMQNRPFAENRHSAYLSWQNLRRRLPPEKPSRQSSLCHCVCRSCIDVVRRAWLTGVAVRKCSDPLRRGRLLQREKRTDMSFC